MDRLRLLLADDHPLLRLGIEALVAPNFDVVGHATDGKTLVEMAAVLKPDVIVLDISMPVLDGLEAARRIKKILPGTKLIYLSMHSNPLYIQQALQTGASAYVLKSSAANDLLIAIDHALRDTIYLSPCLDSTLVNHLRSASGRPSRATVDLTHRQKQILKCIAEGLQNKEIAGQLQIGAKTVEFHRARLMAKLGIRTVGQLTRFAIEEGLVGICDDAQ